MTRNDAPRAAEPADQAAQQKHAAAEASDASRLEHAMKSAEENLAGWLRARADYENLLHRVETERAEATAAGADHVLRTLLPVVDSLSAAVAQMPESLKQDPWGEGMIRTRQLLEDCLRDVGVEVIADASIPFDPNLHEAVAEESSELPQGILTAVIANGYRRNGRVLRPAKVKVSAGPKTTPLHP